MNNESFIPTVNLSLEKLQVIVDDYLRKELFKVLLELPKIKGTFTHIRTQRRYVSQWLSYSRKTTNKRTFNDLDLDLDPVEVEGVGAGLGPCVEPDSFDYVEL